MSNYFLCDVCAHKLDGDHLNTCECLPYPREHRKRAMVDHGRAGGREPYDDPLDVCPAFVGREGA